nr:nucleoside-diphosphate kinase [Pajaroellobacter abortibovis]
MQRTLCIIKPDAVCCRKTGAILARIEEAQFSILGLRKVYLSRRMAERFYHIHRARPFFGELVDFMTRSPVVVAVLEKENAVVDYRNLMGATDPAKAEEGTLRKLFGTDIGENAVHGSDSPENADQEIRFFFAESDLYSSK